MTLREHILDLGRNESDLNENVIEALEPLWTWFQNEATMPYTFYTKEAGLHFIWRDIHRSLEYSAEAVDDSFIIVNHFSDNGETTLHDQQEYYEYQLMADSMVKLQSLLAVSTEEQR